MNQKETPNKNLPNSENPKTVLSGEAEPLWTVEEVARYLQLEPETVRSMARRREIPAFKLYKSNRWRFRKNEIDEWLSQMMVREKS